MSVMLVTMEEVDMMKEKTDISKYQQNDSGESKVMTKRETKQKLHTGSDALGSDLSRALFSWSDWAIFIF
jgi:hypothetical protein